jgi:hypothetical protein
MSVQHEPAPRRELRTLLHGWDPIGVVASGYPGDEYEGLIDPLLKRLGQGAPAMQLEEYLSHELRDHFGLDADQTVVAEFVGRVLEWHGTQSA